MISLPGNKQEISDYVVADEWDDRNLLYSMRYNIGLNVLIPSSGQRAVYVSLYSTIVFAC